MKRKKGFEIVYFEHDHEIYEMTVFAVASCQLCYHPGGQKAAPFPPLLKSSERGKPGKNLQSAT